FASGPAVSPNGDLTYTLAPNAFGSATITVRATDDGGTASGGVDVSPTQTFQINVAGVNDGPVNTVPALAVINEDTPLNFTGGNAVSVADIDVGGGTVQ